MFANRGSLIAATALAAALLAGCTPSLNSPTGAGQGQSSSPSTSPSATTEPVTAPALSLNVPRRNVPVDSMVEITASDGTLSQVRVTSDQGNLAGTLSPAADSWAATDRLEPGTRYRVVAVLTGTDGQQARIRRTFHTQDLTLDQQTFPGIEPLDGRTVGIGMPVIVRFDVPVTDRANIERHLHVTSTPAQHGSWHWISNKEVHWRPVHFWKPGTKVHVDADINSISAGGGIYGQLSRTSDFTIGDAHIYRVNTQTDQMKVFSNGKLLRTIPVTTGKPGFTTRSGVKVIIDKYPSTPMRSETIGIPKSSPDYYDLPDVKWAMLMTYSGEYIHAAPWSVAYQGYSNVSHGCTGMSTANADWLYHMTLQGDVVITRGTDRMMTLKNGWGDWNLSFADYRKGSALH